MKRKQHPMPKHARADVATLLAALSVVDPREAVDADGNVVDIIWLELGEDMLSTLTERDKETVLRRAEVLLEILHLTRLR
jgi:hypothetical protein